MSVVTTTSENCQRWRRSTQGNATTPQSIALLNQLQLSLRNLLNCFAVKRNERNDMVYAIKDLRPQKIPHCSSEVFLRRAIRITQALITIFSARVEPCARTSKLRRTQIRGHHHDRIGEVCDSSTTVSHAPVAQSLQE